MLVKELAVYKSIYCSLCKVTGKKFGIFSRVFLGYDAVFLSVIALSVNYEKLNLKTKKCVLNKFKKCNFCLEGVKELEFIAAANIAFTYAKILDDVRDSKTVIKKIKSFFILLSLMHIYKKAVRIYPKLQNLIKICSSEQKKVENSKNTSFDSVSEPTGKMLGAFLENFCEGQFSKRILKNLGFYLGKLIYILDAVEDYEKDLKSGEFNIFLNKFGSNKNFMKKKAHEILNQITYQILISYNLLETKSLRFLLDNIFKIGIKSVQEKILRVEYNRRNILKKKKVS
jgi:hypothetical protein